MIKLQKISLGVGIVLSIVYFINALYPFELTPFGMGTAGVFLVISNFVVRAACTVFVSNVADKLGRSMLLYGAITLILPSVGLIVVSLVKKKNEHSGEGKSSS